MKSMKGKANRKEKEKKKRERVLALVVLLLLLCIGIGYGLFNQAYNLKGTANVKGHNWALDTRQNDVVSRYNGTYLSPGSNGYATVRTVNGVIEVSYNVDLKDLGDVYTVDFPIVNTGTIDVVLDNITTSGVSQHEDYLKYELFRINNNTEIPLDRDYMLRKNETLNIRIRLTYRNDGAKDITKFPSGGQTFTANILTKLNFGQYVGV